MTKYPAYWVQRLASGVHRVLVVNWGDHAKSLELNFVPLNLPGQHHRIFWTDQSLSLKRGRLSAQLHPHSCLLVEAR